MTRPVSISRRGFLACASLGGLVAAIAPATAPTSDAASAIQPSPAAPAPTASSTPEPVVSFHQDAPFLDYTGQGIPYRPPPGMRAAEALARLTVAEFYSLGII